MRLTRAFRPFTGLLVLPVLLMASLPSLAADEQPTGGRVATVTRLVKLFLEKEASLGAAVRNADASALAALLTDDFELRTGARAASPIPRADWMGELLSQENDRQDIGDQQSGMHQQRARPRCHRTVTGIGVAGNPFMGGVGAKAEITAMASGLHSEER